jgi:hypothetical protein
MDRKSATAVRQGGAAIFLPYHWRNRAIFRIMRPSGDGSPPKLEKMTMKLLTLTLGAVLFTLAVTSADAKIQPPWIVVRWPVIGDCKIWRNDINGPAGPGWKLVAVAKTYPEAWAKMSALYAKRVCV